MPFCAVPGCHSSSKARTRDFTNPNPLTFHSFPSAPDFKEVWLTFVGRPVTKHATLCSRHFAPGLIRSAGMKSFLKANSIPTLNGPKDCSRTRLKPAGRRAKTKRACCFVPGCTTSAENSSETDISFHGFPPDPPEKKSWAEFCSKDPKDVPHFAKICSRHFHPDCLKRKGEGFILLRYSVPSILLPHDFPKEEEDPLLDELEIFKIKKPIKMFKIVSLKSLNPKQTEPDKTGTSRISVSRDQDESRDIDDQNKGSFKEVAQSVFFKKSKVTPTPTKSKQSVKSKKCLKRDAPSPLTTSQAFAPKKIRLSTRPSPSASSLSVSNPTPTPRTSSPHKPVLFASNCSVSSDKPVRLVECAPADGRHLVQGKSTIILRKVDPPKGPVQVKRILIASPPTQVTDNLDQVTNSLIKKQGTSTSLPIVNRPTSGIKVIQPQNEKEVPVIPPKKLTWSEIAGVFRSNAKSPWSYIENETEVKFCRTEYSVDCNLLLIGTCVTFNKWTGELEVLSHGEKLIPRCFSPKDFRHDCDLIKPYLANVTSFVNTIMKKSPLPWSPFDLLKFARETVQHVTDRSAVLNQELDSGEDEVEDDEWSRIQNFDPALELVQDQLKAVTNLSPWSPDLIALARNIRGISQQCYQFLRDTNILLLPSETVLDRRPNFKRKPMSKVFFEQNKKILGKRKIATVIQENTDSSLEVDPKLALSQGTKEKVIRAEIQVITNLVKRGVSLDTAKKSLKYLKEKQIRKIVEQKEHFVNADLDLVDQFYCEFCGDSTFDVESVDNAQSAAVSPVKTYQPTRAEIRRQIQNHLVQHQQPLPQQQTQRQTQPNIQQFQPEPQQLRLQESVQPHQQICQIQVQLPHQQVPPTKQNQMQLKLTSKPLIPVQHPLSFVQLQRTNRTQLQVQHLKVNQPLVHLPLQAKPLASQEKQPQTKRPETHIRVEPNLAQGRQTGVEVLNRKQQTVQLQPQLARPKKLVIPRGMVVVKKTCEMYCKHHQDVDDISDDHDDDDSCDNETDRFLKKLTEGLF